MAHRGFPRLYAAASLKHWITAAEYAQVGRFSAALCRGLIEAPPPRSGWDSASWFSAALCRGLIEASPRSAEPPRPPSGFPRLYAAASLKPARAAKGGRSERGFSAALCRGLIEAGGAQAQADGYNGRFPRLYAAASLKPAPDQDQHDARALFSAALCRGLIEARVLRPCRTTRISVFRGFMPRPH